MGEFEFRRCPVTMISAHALLVVRDARDGRLASMPYSERMRLPAKRLAALRYTENFLLKLKEANSGSN
jgi:hypothetical protein